MSTPANTRTTAFFRFLGLCISANQLTIIRGILALIVITFWLSTTPTHRWIAFIAWIVCWIADGLDGAIARACSDVTNFGKVYDPIIDKIQFYSTAFVMPGLHPTLVYTLFSLDIVSTLERGLKNATGANTHGKAKTVIGVSALGFAALQSLLHITFPLALPNGLLLLTNLCACTSLYCRYINKK